MAAVDPAALAVHVGGQLLELLHQLGNGTIPPLYHLVCYYTSSDATPLQLRQRCVHHFTWILFADFERLGALWIYSDPPPPAATFKTKLWHMYVLGGTPSLVQTHPCPPFVRAFIQSTCDDLVVWLTSGQTGARWLAGGMTEEQYFDQWVQLRAPASLLTSAVVNQAWQLGFDFRRGRAVAAVAAAAASGGGAADDPLSPRMQVAMAESLRTEAERKQEEADRKFAEELDRTPFPSPSPDSSPSREAYDTSLSSFVDALRGHWSVDPAQGSTFEGCTLLIDYDPHSRAIVARLTRAPGQAGAALSAGFAKWRECDVRMLSTTLGLVVSGHSESLEVTFDTSTGGDRLQLIVGATKALQCSRPARFATGVPGAATKTSTQLRAKSKNPAPSPVLVRNAGGEIDRWASVFGNPPCTSCWLSTFFQFVWHSPRIHAALTRRLAEFRVAGPRVVAPDTPEIDALRRTWGYARARLLSPGSPCYDTAPIEAGVADGMTDMRAAWLDPNAGTAGGCGDPCDALQILQYQVATVDRLLTRVAGAFDPDYPASASGTPEAFRDVLRQGNIPMPPPIVVVNMGEPNWDQARWPTTYKVVIGGRDHGTYEIISMMIRLDGGHWVSFARCLSGAGGGGGGAAAAGGGGGASALFGWGSGSSPSASASWRFFNDLAGYASPYEYSTGHHTFTPETTPLLTDAAVDAFIRSLQSSHRVEVAHIVYERTRGPP